MPLPKLPVDVIAESKTQAQENAGIEVSEKAPMTITFSERLDFNGRSTDPEGQPAARADFYGIVKANMEDSLLYCEQQMITFTDREVPLAQLGSMSKGQSKPKADRDALEPANEDAGDPGEAEPPPQG